MAMLARSSGICPLCSVYIRKGQSKIIPLPEAIRPRCTSDGVFSLDDGNNYNAIGGGISQQPRKWIHERCYHKYGTTPEHADRLQNT